MITSKDKCTVEGCSEPSMSLGFCSKHYNAYGNEGRAWFWLKIVIDNHGKMNGSAKA